MALDHAVVMFPQDPFSYNSNFNDYFQGMEDYISGGIISSCETHDHSWSFKDHLGFNEDQEDKSSLLTIFDDNKKNATNNFTNNQLLDVSSSIQSCSSKQWERPKDEEYKKDQTVNYTRRKRRRTKACKNKEEVENQRMTHIAVERNRRKQMNEYLAILRSLMPSSYAQRGDQASIIGGAINFVKELEQLLQTLEAQKTTKNHQQQQVEEPHEASPFGSFFTFPQYTTSTTDAKTDNNKAVEGRQGATAAADIEVTMVESHANVKILAKRCSRQLVKLVNALQNFRLTVQHLNVSSLNHMVLYSISVKVEEGCKLNTVDEIAATVNQMIHKINEESLG